jgi:hypothetical protein
MRDQYFEFKAAVNAYEQSLKESSATWQINGPS